MCGGRTSTVQEVSRHEELQGNFRCDWELGDLRGAVRVAYFVGEVHAYLTEDMWSAKQSHKLKDYLKDSHSA